MHRRLAPLVPITLAVLLLGACGGGEQAAPAPEGEAGGTLTVSAAASLQDVYEQLAEQFAAANPGTEVVFNFGGSDTLAQQIVQGAPADVLATASARTMETAQEAGRIEGEPVVYAMNRLQIATAPGNPLGIATLADMARPDVDEVICAPQVPCGAATEAATEAAGVTLSPISEEQDVRSVLQRVETGNADAGLVYVTDVVSTEGAVQGTDFAEAEAQGAVQSYPIGVVTGAAQPELAQAWVEFVTGEQGRAALAAAGFDVDPG